MSKKPYRAILLDRDGVINHDSDDYIKCAAEWIPIDGSMDAIAALKQKGYLVAVASNQSGVGRGYFDLKELNAMHSKLHSLLARKGVALDRLYFCPHHPDDNCACRKPRTGMLQQFAADFGLQPHEILFIGDTKSDFDCAQAFGCDFRLVLTGKGTQHLQKMLSPVATSESLLAAVSALNAH